MQRLTVTPSCTSRTLPSISGVSIATANSPCSRRRVCPGGYYHCASAGRAWRHCARAALEESPSEFLSAEEIADARELSMIEFQELKEKLLNRTRSCSAFLALYLALVSSGTTTLCGLMGSGASYCYLLWLIRDVDGVQATDWVALSAAKNVRAGAARQVATLLAAYSHALTPRLSVLIALGAGVYYYNNNTIQPLALTDELALLAGFCTYKAALLLQLWDDLKPSAEFNPRPKRPTLVETQDISEEVIERLKKNKLS